MKSHHSIHAHFKEHHKHYLLGMFGLFAVIKMLIFFAGIFGLIYWGDIFAAGNVINSTNITQAPYNCSTNATTCNLYNKNIGSIATNTFINHTNLQTLNLGYNSISSIESGDFNGLSKLTTLYFQQNQLTGVEGSDFNGLNSLTTLYLNINKISSLESGDFNGLSSLTDLAVGNNPLTSIQNNSFNGLSSLTTLYLASGYISTLGSDVFNGLPSLNKLYLNDNQIASITDIDFSKITGLVELDLSYNQISSIESDTFTDFGLLTTLNLSYNQIISIENTDFNGLNSLLYLYLQGNQITSIENTDLDRIPSLVDLYLNVNQISSIQSNSFDGLTSLNNLFLDNNQLTSIGNSDFVGINALMYLYLSSNQISSIQSGSFNELNSLIDLDLSDNQIASIEKGSFNGLNSLLYLYLGSNQITSIKDSYFSESPLLTELYLNYNQINTITSNAFNGLSSLNYLYLNNNQISSIANGCFNELTSLTELDLNTNQITAIESNSFNTLSSLTNLYLNNNQISSIENGDINTLSSLTNLYLNNNQISTIEAGSFNGLSLLNELYLNNNQINYVEQGYFESLTELTTFDMTSNCNANGYESFNYVPGKYVYIDSDNCVLIATSDSNNFATSLESKNYILNADYYVGDQSINFSTYQSGNKSVGWTTETSDTFLVNTIMQSIIEPNYPNIVEVQYNAGTSITSNGQPFGGVIHGPKFFNTQYVPGVSDVVTVMKFGDLNRRIDFSQPVTIRMPALGKNIGDSVEIYSSDENIYGINNPAWTRGQTVIVIDRDGVPYVEFTTTHATFFAIGGGVGSFTINNDDASTSSTSVSFNISTTPEATHMRFSDDGSARSARETYTTTKSWTLPLTYGTKTVYAQFDANNDQVSDVETNDSINYIDPNGGGGGGACIGGIGEACLSLEITAVTGECRYGVNLDLGDHAQTYNAFTMTGGFLSNHTSTTRWSCNDTAGKSPWNMQISSTDLLAGSYSIANATIEIKTAELTKYRGSDSFAGLVGAFASRGTNLSTPRKIFEKTSPAGTVGEIGTDTVDLRVLVPTNQEIGAYQATITIAYPQM